MGRPLVSVITPTFHRRQVLLERCVPCVAAQTYSPVEHIVVSDGPDPVLRDEFAGRGAWTHVRYLEMPEHDIVRHGRWGTGARLAGIAAARGDLIAYLDDDDTWTPDHLEVMAGILAASPDAGFACARATFNGTVIGAVGAPAYGQVSTSTLVHRRQILDRATWTDEGRETIDWDIVRRWMDAGIGWRMSPVVTADLGMKGGAGFEDGIAYRTDGVYP